MHALVPLVARRMASARRTSRVDRAKAGSGQCHEDLGMLGNGGGNFVMSAAKAGVDELPSITGV